MTFERVMQVREVIIERQIEEQRLELRHKERELRILTGAIHAAQGNKAGAKSAQELTLLEPPKNAPKKVRYFPAERANSLFSGR